MCYMQTAVAEAHSRDDYNNAISLNHNNNNTYIIIYIKYINK